MDTVKDLLARVGRSKLARDAGFSQQAISRAVAENMMPASWFPAVREACQRCGAEVPEHLFRWADKRKGAA